MDQAERTASAALQQNYYSEQTLEPLSCPCLPNDRDYPIYRFLDEGSTTTDDEVDDGAPWEIAVTSVVLFFMFLALVSDRMGADSVMITALTAFVASTIISVDEALEGFSNEGLLTVMVLFVVAEGISKTGALDWYMSKLLGQPNSLASAQLRLMIPIAVVSAFLNNTPVVAVMIPIVQKWAKNIRQSPQQLLIPLSFASILGGTCTLIGTSTNLVVVGLLNERYPDDSELSIGLFDLGQYGVPVALAGLAYVLVASPWLLPGSKKGSNNSDALEMLSDADDLLLGARLTQWSPAVNRTVQRSGLRDTGGIYLVSVHRAATGNVHRAVSKDFVLNVGDILYFTGTNVEDFGTFCAEHGLEVVTNENPAQDEEMLNAQDTTTATTKESTSLDDEPGPPTSVQVNMGPLSTALSPSLPQPNNPLETIQEDSDIMAKDEMGCTKESLLKADQDERLRNINRMTDLIRNAHLTSSRRSMVLPTTSTDDSPSTATAAAGTTPTPPSGGAANVVTNILPKIKPLPRQPRQMTVDGLVGTDPAKIVVTVEKELVVVGVNAHDRPGLLLDISKGLLRLNLQLHHTEAAVLMDRSVSIWRCQIMPTVELPPDIEEIWSVLSALLSSEAGVEAMKKRGLRVIRARVINGSRLIGKTAADMNFRELYKAAIVAVRQGGTSVNSNLSSLIFQVGDILILQASDDSPLLSRPPDNFYKELEASLAHRGESGGNGGISSRTTSAKSLLGLLRRSKNGASLEQSEDHSEPAPIDLVDGEDGFFVGEDAGTDADSHIINNDEESNMLSSMQHHEEQELVWKDLLVHFKDEGELGEGVSREFLTAMSIAPKSKFVGKTVAQAGIHKLPDLFLVSIERPQYDMDADSPRASNTSPRGHIQAPWSRFIPKRTNAEAFATTDSPSLSGTDQPGTEQATFVAIDPDEALQEGDVLWFSGSASAVGDLRKIPGLVQYQNEEVEKINERVFDRRLVQAVIARNGPLVGKTVKETQFRTRYGAAVIAVHREGRRVHEHPGRIKLQAGDVLLLEAGPSFIGRSAENDRAFALLAEVKNSAPPRLELLIPALVIAVAMLAVFTAGVVELLVSALVASVVMVALGIISEQEARDAIKWDIYITIASAFGIGTALVNSGVAGGIANFLVSVGERVGMGDAGLLGAVYFATFLISNVVTNNAAAALLFPIAMDAAEQTGTDRILMSYSLMLGASASFMSPFGYTTNLLIYGPGGYKYNDFLLFGTPMQIVLWVLSTAFLVIEQWYISWVATFFLLVCAAASRIVTCSKTKEVSG